MSVFSGAVEGKQEMMSLDSFVVLLVCFSSQLTKLGPKAAARDR